MKATWFAVVVSLFFISFQVLAIEPANQPQDSPPVEENLAKINLNTADVAMLTGSMKGIGKNRAQAIVNYRDAHGPFKSVEELSLIKGLGKSFVSHNLVQLQTIFTI